MARKAYRKANKATSKKGSARNTYLIIGAIAFAAVAGLGALLYLNMRPEPPMEGLLEYPSPERGHDNNVDYAQAELPPAGGVHADIWQNCGIYDEPVDAKNAIHSMEHGAVWITYQPELPEDQIAELEQRLGGQTYLLVSPYPEQRSPIVLTAWGVQVEVDSTDDPRFGQFINRYRVGPQTPEPGAVCTGGLGEPAL